MGIEIELGVRFYDTFDRSSAFHRYFDVMVSPGHPCRGDLLVPRMMKFTHTHRPGFLLGFIDFFTAGLFFLVYMQLGLQDELDEILGRRTQRYAVAYLLGIPTLFIYTLVWMARIAEELKEKAVSLGIEGKLTSFRHMFGWNVFGILFFGPMIATERFFDTLNKVEIELNRRNGYL